MKSKDISSAAVCTATDFLLYFQHKRRIKNVPGKKITFIRITVLPVQSVCICLERHFPPITLLEVEVNCKTVP